MAPVSLDERELDVVVLGATGFTGRLVCKYLNTHPNKPRWGVAGRSSGKLAALRVELSLPETVPTIVVDTSKEDTVRAMARRTKVVINVAGPFRQMGAERVVAICIKEGTSHTDLSGESNYNASLVKYHDKAAQSGSIIVPSSGFDCLPFDLSTYLVAQHLRSQGAKSVEDVVVGFKMGGGISTGTIMSACDMAELDAAQLQGVKPYQFSPIEGRASNAWQASVALPQFGNSWGAYTPFSPHNHRVVNRSWGLLETASDSSIKKLAYGPSFAYRDGIAIPFRLAAWVISIMAAFNMSLLSLSPVRWFLRKVLPQNGGPSDAGFLDLRALARGDGKASLLTLKFQGSPGYLVTARMIAETALLISEDRSKLHPWVQKGGVLTSATVGGDLLAERLSTYAGFQWNTGVFENSKSK